MKKVLLTGGSGIIGRQAIPLLLENGYELHCISSKSSPRLTQHVTWHPLSLMDRQGVTALIETLKPAYLLHFAWVTGAPQFWTSLANLDWVEASVHLVRTFALNGGERVVIAGTCAEYTWEGDYYDEILSPFVPSTLYGSSKRGLYLIVKALCEQLQVSFAWGYIFFVYGPYESMDRFVPTIIHGLLSKDKSYIPCSPGHQLRDFLHTSDVASAFVRLLNSDVSGGVNIASGQSVSLKELAQSIAKIIGGEEKLQFGAIPRPSHDPLKLIPNITRLVKEVGWRPRLQLEEGLKETIAWWKKNL